MRIWWAFIDSMNPNEKRFRYAQRRSTMACCVSHTHTHSCQNGDQNIIFIFIIGHTKLLHFVTHNSYVSRIWYSCICMLFFVACFFVVAWNIHIKMFMRNMVQWRCLSAHKSNSEICRKYGKLSIAIQTEWWKTNSKLFYSIPIREFHIFSYTYTHTNSSVHGLWWNFSVLVQLRSHNKLTNCLGILCK